MKDLNLINFYQHFPDEQACLEYLEQVRWPNGRACPHCGSVKTYRFKSGKLFKCGDCKMQFTAKVGTIFTDTHVPLQKWFLSIYLLTSRKKGTSSVQLAKDLKITQKSAWFVLHRIRYAMEHGIDKPIDTPSEIDATWVGGKSTSKLRFANKVAVMGIAEKQKGTGRIVTRLTKYEDATVAIDFLRKTVKKGSVIHSDEGSAYTNLKREYAHEIVVHSKNEYVRNGVSTNQIDGAWNHLKLGLKATYMGVSVKHLPLFLQEFQTRYNSRELTDGERFGEWFSGVNGKHLPYKSLIS